MSSLRNIRDRTHELIAAVTPSYLHLLPDLVSQSATSTDCGELSLVCRSLFLYRIGLLRRIFFRWSRTNSGIAAQRTRVAFSCWMFQISNPRLPFASSLNIRGIFQPNCCSSVLTALAALLFSCKGIAPTFGSKWITGVVCFIRRCIIQHICERIVGWYSILSARRFAGHWRIVASQLELFRSLGRWRRRQKLLRFFRGWRVLCGQECKVRLHRCFFDTLTYHHIMRRFLTFWRLYVSKLSTAKNRLSIAVKACVLRRTFLAWKQLGPVLLFMSHRYSKYVLKLKRAFFSRLRQWKSVSLHSQQLAERMRASVHVACTGRLMRSTFNAFFHFAASSRLSVKKSASHDVASLMSARHLVCKAFKVWSVSNKENRLLASQQCAIRTYVRRVQNPRILFRFFHRWNDASHGKFQSSIRMSEKRPQVSELFVPPIHRIHAEAVALFDIRRRQRILSRVLQSWQSAANSHPIAAEVDVKNGSGASRLARMDSSSLGQILFEKVVAALGDEVKTALRFK